MFEQIRRYASIRWQSTPPWSVQPASVVLGAPGVVVVLEAIAGETVVVTGEGLCVVEDDGVMLELDVAVVVVVAGVVVVVAVGIVLVVAGAVIVAANVVVVAVGVVVIATGVVVVTADVEDGALTMVVVAKVVVVEAGADCGLVTRGVGWVVGDAGVVVGVGLTPGVLGVVDGLIGHPITSTRMAILVFHLVGFTRIHFAVIGHLSLLITAVSWSLFPLNVCPPSTGNHGDLQSLL